MEARAVVKYIRIPATKMKYVVDLVKDKKVSDAIIFYP